jgi:NADH dehydrogenase (ubiquinone) Fe-S protein 2
MDRLDYVSMMASEHLFSLLVEALGNIKIPERSQYIRMFFLEITRILNHILAVACHALDVGATTPLLWLFEEREKLLELYERVSGARMHAIYIRPGGLFQEFPLNFISDAFQILTGFISRLKEINELLLTNRIWKQRLVDIGIATYLDCYEFGYSGVMLRACGFCWDLRKENTYEKYNEIAFNIPIGTRSDCYDRFQIRMIEMLESARIALLVLNKLQQVQCKKFSFKLKTTKQMLKKKMENLIQHYLTFTKGLKSLLLNYFTKEIFAAVEAPKGELTTLIIADLYNRIQRLKIKAPSFLHLQSLTALTKNSLMADAVTIIGTIDVVFGEIDR